MSDETFIYTCSNCGFTTNNPILYANHWTSHCNQILRVKLKLEDAENRISALEAENAKLRLEIAQTWYPTSEPPVISGGRMCAEVEVAYYYAGRKPTHCYLRRVSFFWADGLMWEYKTENGKRVTYDEAGYTVCFWRYLTPLPAPPEGEG